MRRLIAVVVLTLVPTLAFAQPAQKPEMVILPRQLAEAAAQWIAQPNAGNAVQLYAALQACIADNSPERHAGPDQCPAVTEALAEAKKPAPAAP